ncbi:MAG TPA: thermonuclease family protein [Desulfobulbaceae bacterium]|nr:thermonuclease family protein [Desulfobulbaceae bacterium]
MRNSILLAIMVVFILSRPALAWHGYVVKVLDGDSIRVQRAGRVYEIRLYGIDTPEYKQSFGKKAGQLTRKKIWRKTVFVEPMDVDRYGRIVALIRSDGHLVNRELVRDGAAWVYPQYCKRQPLCRDLKEEENRARLERLGLWKEENPISPWKWKRLNRKSLRRSHRPARSHRQY